MTDVTRILSQIEQGDSHAADRLLPLVYNELRDLAAARLAHEEPGQTLQATALVHGRWSVDHLYPCDLLWGRFAAVTRILAPARRRG